MKQSETITIPLTEYNSLHSSIVHLQQELSWLKRQLFGSKSERFIPNDQQVELDLSVEKTPLKFLKKRLRTHALQQKRSVVTAVEKSQLIFHTMISLLHQKKIQTVAKR